MSKVLKKSILALCLLSLATQAWAVKAKIRFLFPVSSTSVTDGFDDAELKTSEFVLAFLLPVSRNTQLDLGYSYFNARIEDPASVSEAYTGVFRAHLLELGAGYTGFELTSNTSLVFDLSVRIPISGQAEVKSSQDSSEAASISGMGYFFGPGITYGNAEILLFYQRRNLSFDDLTVLRNGKRQDVALNSTEYGLGFGYTF
ncbi:MAG: hypothetical protein H8E38_00950 [SAR324 cluster bacterium]|nr:hypothetical protein [SAR324 cluster bacterium]MBL7035813.1 hypothetical protein [SAR324 cluster bacterium]